MKPSEFLRNAKIRKAHQSEDGWIKVELRDGSVVDVDVEDVLTDWLRLHQKIPYIARG